jgi:O-antigen/teichoic acid export membrane protein
MVVQLALLASGTLSARMLGPTNRGYLAILATCASTVGQVGAVGISLAATYYLAAGRISGKEIVALLRSSAAIQLVTLTTIYAAIVFGYALVSGAPILFAACVSLLQLPAALALDYGIALALGGRSHGVASGARAVPPMLYAMGLTYLFVRGGGTLNSVMVVLMTSAVLGGTLALALGLRIAFSMRPRESLLATVGRKAARREVLAFGRRGYIGYLSPTDSFRLDQLLLGFLAAPHVLGVYAVGAAFTNFTRIVAVNVGMSATSEVARHADADAQRAIVRHTLALAAGLITAITICVGLGVVVGIPLLFGKVYQSAVPVAEWLLVATWFLSMKRISVDLIRGAGELRIGTGAEIINLVVFLTFCGPAAVAFGGAGVAACLAGSAACGSAYLVQKMHRLEYV